MCSLFYTLDFLSPLGCTCKCEGFPFPAGSTSKIKMDWVVKRLAFCGVGVLLCWKWGWFSKFWVDFGVHQSFRWLGSGRAWGAWLLAWPGLSGCSIYIFLTGFGGILQCCNTRDSTARSCVTFCSRIHSAQLRASSDPTAAACSWHGTLSICRGESPPATGKLTPVKKKPVHFCAWSCPQGELAGWVLALG